MAATARGALEVLWSLADLDREALDRIELTGEEPALPSVFRIGTAASACIGAAGLAASELWRLRTGAAQPVRVAMRHAAVAYRSERYLRVDGAPVEGPHRAQSYFRDASGRWMQLHMAYPHHREGILRELGCADDDGEIARTFARRDAFEVEDALAARGLPGYALRIHPPHLPELPVLAMDGGRGKRCAHVDLRDAGDRRAFDALIEGADVFVQGFRPGGLASLGYAPDAVAERRPGIVYVTLSAWGESGPWAKRHGFDSLVQTATGIVAEGSAAKDAGEPAPLPCQALDHSSGYLAAFGAMVGLARRATEGGSWLVRVSLAATGRWLDGLGRVEGLSAPDPDLAAVTDRLEWRRTAFGEMTSVRCAEELPATPPAFALPAAPLGSHRCEWA